LIQAVCLHYHYMLASSDCVHANQRDRRPLIFRRLSRHSALTVMDRMLKLHCRGEPQHYGADIPTAADQALASYGPKTSPGVRNTLFIGADISCATDCTLVDLCQPFQWNFNTADDVVCARQRRVLMETILIVVLLVLLLGGGGWWRGPVVRQRLAITSLELSRLRFGFCPHRRRFYFRRLLADRVTFERPVTRFFFNADDRPDEARFALLGDLSHCSGIWAGLLPPRAFIQFFGRRG